MIFDADGINTLAKMDLNELKGAQNKIIITPHVKEFSRISKIRERDIMADPIKKVKDFATADALRDEIAVEDIVLLDGAEKSIWQYK